MKISQWQRCRAAAAVVSSSSSPKPHNADAADSHTVGADDRHSHACGSGEQLVASDAVANMPCLRDLAPLAWPRRVSGQNRKWKTEPQSLSPRPDQGFEGVDADGDGPLVE